MAASMNFYPGGAEDESDSDDDGFVLGDDSYGQKKENKFLLTDNNYTPSTGRGGFGKPSDKCPSGNIANRTTKQQQPKPVIGMDDFRMAILRGNIEAATSYIKQGCNVNTVLKGGWTALMYAASSAHPEIVSLLLEKGANPKCHNDFDMYTALMAACASTTNRADDVLKCVNLLLDKGADVNAHDRFHMSALTYAAREGREALVTKLLDAGANINKQDSRGWTSLSWATNKNQLNVMKILLSNGALNLKHCDGLTALDIAVMQDYQESHYLVYSELYRWHKILITCYGITGLDRIGGVVKYGELELFLSGLGLRTLVPTFQHHHVDFSTFLQMTDEDLIKMKIQQFGIRRKILDGIQDVHKKEWEKSSINAIPYNKMIRLADSVAMVANISRHTKFIKSNYDGTSPIHLHENVQETINNVQSLQDELRRFNTHLCKALKDRDYDPPDLIKPRKTKKSKLRIKRLFVSGALLGTIIAVIWKRETIQETFNSLLTES
ncbi:hypothetical protein KUTeg_021352 [Tegillarca granosa]|uniref:Ankyrin repeat, SAM and basic leucine zipper domain-containing protein 1 n=1 Tax=Tegillarca granosa TaxID=220873 RepID=A0ABQ9EFS8_TEGGR|nr:hypothetical protein KUTeg_021352 [Tegillarca granosa]